MISARFTFHPDLNDFLPPPWRGGNVDYPFEAHQSVKHLLESAGVPHTEIGQIQANHQTVGFDYRAQDGDKIDIWPAAAGHGEQPGDLRFVIDNHLGRLAAYLRVLGFDSIYHNDFEDEALAQISADEARILLTRDRRLLMRKIVQYGYCLRSLNSRRQLDEVVRRYDLSGRIRPFRRCLRCNALRVPVAKEAIIDRLEPLTRQYYDEFHICPDCGQIYWKGSHYEHLLALIQQIQGE